MWKTFKKCWALLPAPYRWGMFGLFLLMNLSALAQLAMVGSILPFLRAISDPAGTRETRVFEVLSSLTGPVDDATFLMLLGCLVIGAVLAANLLGAMQSILGARFSAKLDSYLSTLLLKSYLLRPYTFYLNHNTSDFLRNIFSEVYLVSNGFLSTSMAILSRSLTVAGLSVLLLVVNPWVALGAGAFFGGAYTGIYLLLRPRLVRASKKRAESDSLRYKAVAEAFDTIKEIKVLRREPNFISAFEKPTRRYFHFQERAALYSMLPKYVVETIAFAGMIGVAMLLIRQYDGVAGALPVLGLFAVAGYRLIPAIQGLYSNISKLRYYRKSVETIHEECSRLLVDPRKASPGLPVPPKSEGPRQPLTRAIEFNNIRFTYPQAEQPALKGVSLEIPALARIGLCGRSGAGKTTLADILLGLLHPQEGTMCVDGVPINEENQDAWQRNCGYVPQQIYLIDDSIRRNIAFGIDSREISDERVKMAARLANLHDFIVKELPSGYDTEVGERGIRLSGGQRQRIGIARALYDDPEVIVLDEATSALDSETERAIVEAVESLAGRKTVIMIAHRLTTIRRADTIVFMEDGLIAGTGTFDELHEANPLFRRMAEA